MVGKVVVPFTRSAKTCPLPVGFTKYNGPVATELAPRVNGKYELPGLVPPQVINDPLWKMTEDPNGLVDPVQTKVPKGSLLALVTVNA